MRGFVILVEKNVFNMSQCICLEQGSSRIVLPKSPITPTGKCKVGIEIGVLSVFSLHLQLFLLIQTSHMVIHTALM